MKFFFSALLLISVCTSQAQPSTATEIMNDAKKEAAASGKNIFIIFHASWCGWCHKMDTAMNEPKMKPLFDKNYVIKHLTVLENGDKKVLENPGADAMLEQYHGKEGGIPFWLIFDKNGKLLADSREVKADGTVGENVGCPASEAEVNHFANVLKKTSKLTDLQIAVVKERFRKNSSR